MKLHFKKYEMIKSSDNIQEGTQILDKCDQFVQDLMKEKGIGCKKYNEPHLIIVVPGIEQVEKFYKQLLKKYKKFSGKQYSDAAYDIRISKLWGKHLKPTDYEGILEKKHDNRKVKKVLNIYLGAPSRLNILANQKVLKIDQNYENFQYLIIDCSSSSKSDTTVFENNSTREDILEFLIQCKDAFQRVPADSSLNLALIK